MSRVDHLESPCDTKIARHLTVGPFPKTPFAGEVSDLLCRAESRAEGDGRCSYTVLALTGATDVPDWPRSSTFALLAGWLVVHVESRSG